MFLQESEYRLCISPSMVQVFWNTADGQCYTREGKYRICAYHLVTAISHLNTCPDWRESYAKCRAKEGGKHNHPAPTRVDWGDLLFQWKVMCTQYLHYDWTVKEAIEYASAVWPVDMGYNPRYVKRKMLGLLTAAAWHGADGKNQVWKNKYGVRANLSCEALIDVLMDESSWSAQKLGKDPVDEAKASRLIFVLLYFYR